MSSGCSTSVSKRSVIWKMEALAQGEEGLRTTTTLRRCSSPSSRTVRIVLRRVEGYNLLKPDFVPPQVVEVILVEKALVDAEAEVGEAKELGIVRKAHAAGVSNAIVFAVDDEAMEVRVGPAKGRDYGIAYA